VAIDLAHGLSLPLFDPDSQITVDGRRVYQSVDPTIEQPTATTRPRPATGHGLLGGGVFLGQVGHIGAGGAEARLADPGPQLGTLKTRRTLPHVLRQDEMRTVLDTANRAADNGADRAGGIVADVSTVCGAIGNALRLRGGQRGGDSGENDDNR